MNKSRQAMITDGHDPMNYPDMIESLMSENKQLEQRIAQLEDFIRQISKEDRFAIFGVWPQHAKELLEQGNQATSP